MTPEGWIRLPLSEVGTLQRGFDLPVQDRRPGHIPVVASNGPVGVHDSAPVKGPGVVTGRSGTIGKVFFYEHDFWPLNTTLYVSDFHENHPQYIALLLASLGLGRFVAATGVPSLNRNFVHPVPVLVPPIPEQRKIAAILSSVDDAIEGTQTVIDQLQVVKKAMMADLLTRGIPGLHKKFKQTEIGEVPVEWEVVRAGDLCDVITKGATPAQQNRGAGDVPFLKVYNIDPKGFIDFAYQPTFIPNHVHSGELRRSRVLPGDVLMNIVGPPLGKVAVVPPDFPESNINQAIAVFRPVRVEPEFLANCLEDAGLFAWASSRAKRTSTQLNLTLEICRDYPLPFPSARERSEINTLLSACKARLDAEAKAMLGLREVKSALMSVLLTGEVRVRVDEESAA